MKELVHWSYIDCTALGRMEYTKKNRIRQKEVCDYLDAKLFAELKQSEKIIQPTLLYKIKRLFKVGK